ncbi:MAG: TIGR02757 family protein [Desulfomonilaceae bacterium]
MPAERYLTNLCELYDTYNKREFVHPDPLEFLYDYDDIRDREIVALVSSSLAYGGVKQILKSVSAALSRIPDPADTILSCSRNELIARYTDFKHRFTTGEELALMLFGIQSVIKEYGSLQACFVSGLSKTDETILPALANFVSKLSEVFDGKPRSLLPSPVNGSACKRLNLFLRWMIRKDEVDPGGWDDIPTSKLVVPVDIHMRRISSSLGLTSRKAADLKTAVEITNAFRKISPDDPVRYDFCLTRLGIRDDLDPATFLKSCEMVAG